MTTAELTTYSEETEEETEARMITIQEGEEQQFVDLQDLMEAELDYFKRCKEIMDDLRDNWPSV
jgi:endophilin-A